MILRGHKTSWLDGFVAVSFTAYVLGEFVGGHILENLMSNQACYPYLGCNVDFGGYDAIVHFFIGVMKVAIILWLVKEYPKWNIFRGSFFENLVVFIALLALLGVVWEMMEFVYDAVGVHSFHLSQANPNQLAQASNADTMGDMFFDLLGGTLAVLFWKLRGKDVFGQDK